LFVLTLLHSLLATSETRLQVLFALLQRSLLVLIDDELCVVIKVWLTLLIRLAFVICRHALLLGGWFSKLLLSLLQLLLGNSKLHLGSCELLLQLCQL
jgi:hypothetical protein